MVNLFILFFGAAQGILMLIFLMSKPKNRPANLYLSLFIWVLICQILMKVAQKVWLRQHILWFYDISYFLPLLYAPLVYLYIRHYLHPSKPLNVRDLPHFIPFASVVFIHSFYWLFHEAFYIIFNYSARIITQWLSLGIYTYLNIRQIQHWKNQNLYKPETHHTQFNWLKNLNYSTLGVGILISTALVLLHAYHPQYAEYRMLFLSLTVFIYWFSFQAICNPLIFSGILCTDGEKYAHSSLSDHEANTIYLRLNQLMQQEKYYLDAELNLQKLANQLKTSKHRLSQVLNEVNGKNYYDFVNEYRVKEAQVLLLSPDKQHLTIAALAYEAGFSSLSSFNEIFKKHTQLTPTQFRKKMLIIS
jgi:AraC-like DNA-binding protein